MKYGKSLFKNVDVSPDDYLAFEGKNIDVKRKVRLTISNSAIVDIAFKLKSTSPDVIKMNPGYGYLRPLEKIAIAVHLFPLRDRPRKPSRERLTVLLAVAPATNRPEKPADLWRRGKLPEDPFRIILPIKIEGYEGFKGRLAETKRRAKNKKKKREEESTSTEEDSDED